MEMHVRIYFKKNGHLDTRAYLLNEGETDDMVSDYIKKEYLRDGETLDSVEIEGVNF